MGFRIENHETQIRAWESEESLQELSGEQNFWEIYKSSPIPFMNMKPIYTFSKILSLVRNATRKPAYL